MQSRAQRGAMCCMCLWNDKDSFVCSPVDSVVQCVVCACGMIRTRLYAVLWAVWCSVLYVLVE